MISYVPIKDANYESLENLSSRLGQDEGHFGIDGIRERPNCFGGSLQIDSTPGHGTYVRLTISHGAGDSPS